MRSRQKKLLIFGHYGVPNWGDEAILAGFVKAIDRKKWDITVVSPFSDFLRKEHKLPAVPPPPFGLRSIFSGIRDGSFKKTYQTIRAADFVIFGGGGLFQESPPRALRIWSFYLKICKRLKKKILLLGNSVGPFCSERSLRKTGKLFESVSFFSVRDTSSSEMLEKMEVPTSKVSQATDFSFFLPQKRKHSHDRKGALIALRKGDLSTSELREIKKFCQILKKKYRKVEFLSLQSNQSHDEQLAKTLKIKAYAPKSLREVRKRITGARFVLTNRLHGALLAMLSTTPFLAFASRPKIIDFLESAGLSEYVFSEKITTKNLEEHFRKVVKNISKARQEIRAAVQKEREKTIFLLPGFF